MSIAKIWKGPVGALRTGVLHAARAWPYVLLAYAVNVTLSLILAVFVQDALRSSLGSSLAGERMRSNWDSFWYGSFSAQADGVAATFRPTVSGPGAVLDALDAMLDGFVGVDPNLWPVIVSYWIAWSFWSGGFVSLFVAPDRRVGFLARAAGLFRSFLPLSLIGLCGYAAILGPARSWGDSLVASVLVEVSDERVHFAWTLGQYALLWALVLLVSLLMDYAKVFVARDSSGVGVPRLLAGSLGTAARFIVARFPRVVVLHGLTGGVFLLMMAFYVAFAPGALDATTTALLATFLFGQAYVMSRMALRCVFYASEAALVAQLVEAPRDAR